MKRKNFISGLLAGALVLTSVIVPGAQPVKAEEYDLTEGLKAFYSFDDENLSDEQGGEAASAIVTGLGNYTGDLEYIDGQSGKGLQLGDYGLKLNRENLGENFTVSLWIKPDNTIQADQSTLFLGWHSPEKWLAIAGNADNSTEYRFWANGNGYSWTNLGNRNMDSSSWHQVTITGSADTVTAYLDGQQWGTGASNSPLAGDNQDIYVGVTYWDDEFTGAVDEIKVYDRTLSAGEAYRLYDAETSAEELLGQGITVTDSLNMVVGREEKISVSMHPVAADSNPEISYASSDEKVAEVSADGTVTAVGSGETVITTTVTLGSVTETAETKVTVSGNLDDRLVASYDFDGDLDNSAGDGATPDLLVTGLKSYNGSAAYADGKDGQAIQLGDYGLKLNLNDLGTEYTVSMWVKSDKALAGNQVMLFMGYHDPENWLAISGDSGDKLKFWANGGIGQWVTLASPVVPSGQWHQITVTGTAGKTTLYLDGITLGTSDSNDPLDGANADIYLGVNYWDPEYAGLMDDVKIYNIAMSEAEVQEQAADEFQAELQYKLSNAVERDDLIGKNDSADEIKYDMELPSEVDGLKISWSSSNPAVIADDGTIVSPEEKTDVTLTGTVSYGKLSAKVEFTYTAVPLDRTALDELIKQAEAVDTTLVKAVSKERLENAITAAKEANSFTTVEEALTNLQFVMENLEYAEEAINPFLYLADPETEIQLKEGESKELFSIPEAVSQYVEVEYTSENPAVAVYENGTVKAAAEGKVIVTATVTAKYDGFQMKYSTAVSVTGSGTPTPTQEPTETPTQTPTQEPTQTPTQTPTQEPTQTPTQTPTQEPTQTPTQEPTDTPATVPTGQPSGTPGGSQKPSGTPGGSGTQKPTGTPSGQGGQAAATGDATNVVLPAVTAAAAAVLLAGAAAAKRRSKRS